MNCLECFTLELLKEFRPFEKWILTRITSNLVDEKIRDLLLNDTTFTCRFDRKEIAMMLKISRKKIRRSMTI